MSEEMVDPFVKHALDELLDATPAKYTVFWPGQTIHVCERHYGGIENLSSAMGMPMPDSREEEGYECENCINEKKI